jgi:hypothetical protein
MKPGITLVVLFCAFSLPGSGYVRVLEAGSCNVVINGNAESGDLSGWSDALGHGFNILSSGQSTPVQEGAFSFWAGITGASGALINEIYQDIDLSVLSGGIDIGIVSGAFAGYARSNSASGATDFARVIVEYRSGADAVLAAYDSGNLAIVNTWVQLGDTRIIPPGTRKARIRLHATRSGGASTDAFFDSISLCVPTAAGIGDNVGEAAIVPLQNPARGGVVLRLTSRGGGVYKLDLISASGRLVRTFGGNWDNRGLTIAWDGRTIDGSRAAPGIYFARLQSSSSPTVVKRITLLPR